MHFVLFKPIKFTFFICILLAFLNKTNKTIINLIKSLTNLNLNVYYLILMNISTNLTLNDLSTDLSFNKYICQ